MAIPYYSPKPPGGRQRLVLKRGGRRVEVVGLKHFRKNVEAIVGQPPEGEGRELKQIPVYLVREPNNLYDQNAIGVWALLHGQLGYIPKEYAARFAPAIDDALVPMKEKLDIEVVASVEASWIAHDEDEEAEGPAEVESVTITVSLTNGRIEGSIEAPLPTRRPTDVIRKIERLSGEQIAKLDGYIDALLAE